MEKVAAKNKAFFYLATFVTALFLALTVMPQANAESLGDDITPPDDVENLQIEVYDGAALLSWDVATDDEEVVGYNIYSGPEAVTSEGGEYSYEVIDAGDVIEYLVEGLENGEDIYFTVTAYDAAGNESENYSNEVYGTPDPSYGDAPDMEHGAADEEPPTVSDAQALDNETVEVTFSEAVVLPADSAETAFSIINNATSETLAVVAVEMDPEDVLGQVVLLTTDPQEGGAEYILTAGIQVEDTASNPIVSGTSDTAAFIGSTVEPGSDLTGDLPDEDFEAPTVVSAEAMDMGTVQIVFSEPVILDSDPELNFFISEADDATNELSIMSVERDDTGSVITIETSDQDEVDYSVIVTGVLDENGNEIDDLANTATFMGNGNSTEDLDTELSEEFEEAWSNCEEGYTESVITLFGIMEYKINGMDEDLCEFTVTLTKSPDPENIPTGIDMTCKTENSTTFKTMQQEIDSSDICEGPLVDLTSVSISISTDDDGLALTPENVKNFVASLVGDLVVSLSWEMPDDPSIIDQILYKSTDGGDNYDAGTSLGMDKEEVEVTGLTPGTEYYFKLTTKDLEGNESDGVIAHIMLPETGMGVGLLVGASMGLAAFRNRKKK